MCIRDRSSIITFDATISPQVVDKTKRWGIGVGYGTNGTAYTVDFPVDNSNHLNGWAYNCLLYTSRCV